MPPVVRAQAGKSHAFCRPQTKRKSAKAPQANFAESNIEEDFHASLAPLLPSVAIIASDASRMSQRRFASFAEFYPFYLQEHSSRTSRRLHVVGTSLAMIFLVWALVTQHWQLLWAVPVAGYALAWIGHFAFERNSPATFKHPLYSLRGDFTMLRDVLTGRIRW
jgi:hypothetical protein